MDGNGRWAQRQGLPRIEGHRQGLSVRRVTEESRPTGHRAAHALLPFQRELETPAVELEFLMHLLQQYMIQERSTIMEHNIRVSVIGRREGLPTRR